MRPSVPRSQITTGNKGCLVSVEGSSKKKDLQLIREAPVNILYWIVYVLSVQDGQLLEQCASGYLWCRSWFPVSGCELNVYAFPCYCDKQLLQNMIVDVSWETCMKLYRNSSSLCQQYPAMVWCNLCHIAFIWIWFL